MELKYKMDVTTYLSRSDQIAWPINKAGDSINIRTNVYIDNHNLDTMFMFSVHIGLMENKAIFKGKTYKECHEYIVEYVKDRPVIKKIMDWVEEIHPKYVCVERWFSIMRDINVLYTEKEAVERMKELTLVPSEEFYKSTDKYRPKKA